MRIGRISRGGQIQVPAEVRRRWATDRVIIEDDGASLRIQPLPDDPIGTAFGSLPGKSKMTSDEMRRQFREEERLAEERKWSR
jgi:bifunctional DNA-binding transcriptional regulator/antitoxin component of YhaV-PrlF toxin-antitoxin module